MPAVQVGLAVTFATPPSVGAGGTAGTLVDKVVTRNACGEFIIPASQVRGKLRHACEQLLRSQGAPLCRPPQPDEMCPNSATVQQPPCLLCEVFGSPGCQSRLSFHDLLVKNPESLPQDNLRWMVSLNRRRRTAEAQRLFVVETAPHFAGLIFENGQAITGQVKDERHIHLLLAALKMVFAWGGGSSRGLGWGLAHVSARVDGKLIEKPDVRGLKALWESSRSS